MGLAVCFLGLSTFEARPLLNLHDLVVHPEYRGMGIGRGLLSEVEALALRLACCRVTLEVRQDNRGAMHLYSSFGFSPPQPPRRHTRSSLPRCFRGAVETYAWPGRERMVSRGTRVDGRQPGASFVRSFGRSVPATGRTDGIAPWRSPERWHRRHRGFCGSGPMGAPPERSTSGHRGTANAFSRVSEPRARCH